MTIEQAKQEIQELYCADDVPWVIGYSGGKDSSAILQLTWLALADLPEDKRTKPVHVISTDTLVENPIVAAWVDSSLDSMRVMAESSGLPITPHKLTPETDKTFWVNLIGRGYPAPRNKFRWCTERMKISPSTNFIRSVVRKNGEVILLLGIRKAESSKRHANMKRHAIRAVRDRLTPNSRLTNCLVYTPIEDWSNDDVWVFLMQIKNPWGHSNKELLTMYRGATEDGDCPLVVDETTPSCGSSRFGCWVCTLVDQDKSMAAMIQNDVEKEWMTPLLEFRDKLDFRGDEARTLDRSRRDYRRITGQLTYQVTSIDGPKLVHGPYTQEARAHWLRELLKTQELVRGLAPEGVKGSIELIQLEELEEIRRIWVFDKHEIEDLLPTIYEESTGRSYPGRQLDDGSNFDADALKLMRSLCSNGLQYEMIRNLLDVERQHRNQAKRKNLFQSLEDVIQRCFYESEDDALARARALHEAKHATLDDDDQFEDHVYVPTIEGHPLDASEVHS
jgi:DNA sulfur modification protein DndC